MQKGRKYKFSIKLAAEIDFIDVATSFIENSSIAFGLSEIESMGLILATEEIFAYLCKNSPSANELEIKCTGGGWFVMVDFALPVEDFNLRVFNITSTASPDDDAYLEEMGLFLASRQVDHFQVTESDSGEMLLSLIKEKTYPAIQVSGMPVPRKNLTEYSIKRPDSDEIKFFAAMAVEMYSDSEVPTDFTFPGKLVDMIDMKDYDALIALSSSSKIGGGIIWKWSGPKTIEFFGPYIFNQSDDTAKTIAKELLHSCIGSIAKTHAVALINRLSTDFLPKEEFEVLGTLNIYSKDGVQKKQPTYFRQMHEDAGCTVKAHPDLTDFLESEYSRLFLPREIQTITDAGEQQTPFSVITANFDKNRDIITLKPIKAGADSIKNLKNHVNLFSKQPVCNLFFEMDLGVSWQVRFTPALMQNGFTPKLIIPYAGHGDLVIFHWERPENYE